MSFTIHQAKLPIKDEEHDSEKQGKKRETTANQADVCQNLLVFRWRRI